MGEILLTPEGLESLTEELEQLGRERAVLRDRMRRALDQGGAAPENGEYLDAARSWELLERRAGRLERRLREAEVVQARRDGEVDVGERVVVRDLRSGVELSYRVVGSGEADPTAGEVSHESPIGAALLGRRVGDVVKVKLPRRTVRLEVVEIDG